MALQTDLNVFPYYDDYDSTKNFYRVLFRPGVAVQARELNQLQSILQNQIERFGDNIFKRGTIIDGCNIVTQSIVPYVKVKDIETDGTQINVNAYQGLTVRNSSNVTAYIVKTTEGFESRSPDLNTLFVTYNSSGVNFETSTFSAGENLTVYDSQYPLFKTRVINGSSLFSNTDGVVFVSAIAVQNSTGGNTFPAGAFSSGHTIQNGVANLVIIEANATINTSALVLKVRPLAVDLLTANNIKWRFSAGESIRNATTSNTAIIAGTIGSGADGSLVTDTLGKVLSISITGPGSGYYVPPHTTIRKQTTSALTATEYGDLDVQALNYLAVITVANAALSPIGAGYGVTVDEGTVYQKGFFSRVSQQLVIVNKYSNTGFDKSVGFYTNEDLIDSNEDTSLLDNATGTYNYAAPGADRLKLIPELRVLEKDEADANTEFLPVIEFADGRPYKKSQSTVYNVIGDELAKRTYDESGNYVLDQFIVTTHDSSNIEFTANSFAIDVDPGIAYINGYKLETQEHFKANVAKGVAVGTNNAARIKLGYGSYVRVKQLAGNFSFNIGAQVELHTAAVTYITSNAGNAITSPATKIGDARIRSITLESGEPGTANAVYRIYLFDVVMSSGKNFGDTRSVYHAGTNKGIADIITDASGQAVLEGASASDTGLLFPSQPATKSISNISYTYRTINQTETANTTGYIELNLGAGEFFPYTGALTSTALQDLLVIPKENYESANATGTITLNSTTAVTGAGGTNFTSIFNPGDFIKFANSTGGTTIVSQIAQVTGASSMILTTAATSSYSSGTVRLYYPANVPVSLTNKTTRYANVSVSNSQVMTIYLANNIANSSGSSSSANVMVAYNATKNNASSSVKTATRSVYTRLVCSNNAGSVRGPWALGLSDAFRLRKVYQANGASVGKSFNANTGILNSGTANAFVTITDNPFANGDSFVYADNTTTVTGLTDTSTYYAVYANNTGMALASTRGGANLTLTATATSENHTLTGQPIFFTGDTYGIFDVTNDFYIDTNQKEDYLDTSYLYRKPRATTLGTNDVLLVQYDVFTGGDSGVKTISSYTITDTLTFNALSAQANVHTLEIPEMLGTGGKYYDLRDQYDFRPRSANTIDLITNISTVAAGANAASIINPTEPTDANRFSAAEKFFPAPNTDLTANIEFYLGRSDRISIDTKGDFIVRAGKNGFMNDIPPEPKDSLTLQIITIPPYPSLPGARSTDVTKILDTKVANEIYGKRIQKYTVKLLIGPKDIDQIQFKRYKMADIGVLERRIKTLEYYVGFTLAEALAKARYIPSSIDAAVDRFRFGFFVDPFTDYNYSDLANPEFYATIREDRLGPKLQETNLEFRIEDGSTGIITLPYNEFTIVAQNDATDGVTSGPVEVTTVTQTTSTVIQSQRSNSSNDNGLVHEDFFFTFSTLAGPAEFYINGRDNNMALEIYQATDAGGNYTTYLTSAAALPLTNSDITSKGLSVLNGGRKIEHPGTLERRSYGPVGGWIVDQFKLTWVHNPNNGIYYKIRVYKGRKSGGTLQNSRGGTYGFKLYYPTDVVTVTRRIVPNSANFNYKGIVHTIEPREFTVIFTAPFSTGSDGYVAWREEDTGYIADAQKFLISVVGLKPNTLHKFIFDGSDSTSKCSQNRNTTTNTTGLLSDVNGTLNFDFYYDAGLSEVALTDVEQRNRLAALIAGNKAFTIESNDGNSSSAGAINLKYYTNIPGSYTNNTGLNVSQTATDQSVGNQNVGSTPIAQADSNQAIGDAIDSRSTIRIRSGGAGGRDFTYNNNTKLD